MQQPPRLDAPPQMAGDAPPLPDGGLVDQSPGASGGQVPSLTGGGGGLGSGVQGGHVAVKPKGHAGRIVGGLVVVATLLGGIAAALQIRDARAGKWAAAEGSGGGGPPAVTQEDRSVAGPAGSRIVLPEGWAPVSRNVLEATMPGIGNSIGAEDNDAVFLEGPDAPGEATHMFGFLVYRDVALRPDVESFSAEMRTLTDVLTTEIRESQAGPMAFVLSEHHLPDPDGRDVAARSEQFVWIKDGHMWSLLLSAPSSMHFRHSEEFRRMAESVTLP